MANFPTSLPSLVNPVATDYLNSPAHATQHGNVNDETTAVATKIGTGASTPTDNKVLRGTGTGTSAWGQIDNGDVSSSAAITESKVFFGGTANQYPSSDGDGTLTWKTLTVGRAFTWTIKGTLTVANEQGAKYIVPEGMTVVKIWAKTGSGTCTIRVQEGTGNVDASFAVTSSVGSSTSFDDSSIAAGSVLTLDITAISSGVDLFVTLECKHLVSQ